MPVRAIVAIVAVVGMMVCILTSVVLNFRILDKVNQLLPEKEQFPLLWWTLPKTLRMHREYKRLYPDGSLVTKYWILTALVCVIFFVFCFSAP